MFQPYVLFKTCSYHKGTGKGGPFRRVSSQIKINNLNSAAFAEGEGATATSLGRPKGEIKGCFGLIHRVPSVEGATATSLGNLKLIRKRKKINRKCAPNGLSLRFKQSNIGG